MSDSDATHYTTDSSNLNSHDRRLRGRNNGYEESDWERSSNSSSELDLFFFWFIPRLADADILVDGIVEYGQEEEEEEKEEEDEANDPIAVPLPPPPPPPPAVRQADIQRMPRRQPLRLSDDDNDDDADILAMRRRQDEARRNRVDIITGELRPQGRLIRPRRQALAAFISDDDEDERNLAAIHEEAGREWMRLRNAEDRARAERRTEADAAAGPSRARREALRASTLNGIEPIPGPSAPRLGEAGRGLERLVGGSGAARSNLAELRAERDRQEDARARRRVIARNQASNGDAMEGIERQASARRRLLRQLLDSDDDFPIEEQRRQDPPRRSRHDQPLPQRPRQPPAAHGFRRNATIDLTQDSDDDDEEDVRAIVAPGPSRAGGRRVGFADNGRNGAPRRPTGEGLQQALQGESRLYSVRSVP